MSFSIVWKIRLNKAENPLKYTNFPVKINFWKSSYACIIKKIWLTAHIWSYFSQNRKALFSLERVISEISQLIKLEKNDNGHNFNFFQKIQEISISMNKPA
jgi:hypothetical protein